MNWSKASNYFVCMVFGYFFWLMLKLTFNYIPASQDVAFLALKQTEVFAHSTYLPLFYTHVYTGILVLLFGFLSVIRRNFGIKNFHKTCGKIYIVLLLLFCAPAGIYMGVFANGGVLAKLSFVMLGTIWWAFTFAAWKSALHKKFIAHKKWMWRSFALTLSAITLRFWKMLIVLLFQPAPMDVYEIVAWAGWVPNLLLIEYLLQTNKL